MVVDPTVAVCSVARVHAHNAAQTTKSPMVGRTVRLTALPCFP